jgi:membrane-bound lytic murein transglycosylase
MPADMSAHWEGRGGYVSHLPQEPVQPNVPAARFEGGDVFQRAAARLNYNARKYGEHVQQASTANYSEQGRAKVIESYANTEAARDAVAAVDEVQAHRDQLAARVEQERAALATGTDSGEQIAAQRQWERDRAQLEARGNVGKVHATAANMIRNASPAQVKVLAEELPGYLAAKGHPAAWVNDALAQAAPDYAAAQHDLADADRKLIKLRHNLNVTARAYSTHKPVNPDLLVDPT